MVDSPSQAFNRLFHPVLTLADVHAALAYFYDNRDEVERAAADDLRFVENLRGQIGPVLEQKLADEAGPPNP